MDEVRPRPGPGRPTAHHLGLTTPDLDRGVAFRVAAFGMRLVRGPETVSAGPAGPAGPAVAAVYRDLFGPGRSKSRLARLGGGGSLRLEPSESAAGSDAPRTAAPRTAPPEALTRRAATPGSRRGRSAGAGPAPPTWRRPATASPRPPRGARPRAVAG